MPDRRQQLDIMGGLLEADGPPRTPTTPAEQDTVRCQVCRLDIDATTGEPLQEVTQDNVEAVRQYMQESGQAELGGEQLDLDILESAPAQVL